MRKACVGPAAGLDASTASGTAGSGRRDAIRIEQLKTPHLVIGRGGEEPRAIVVHTTVGSFESAASWFASPESRVSAHYLVGLHGRVAQFVAEKDMARHAGRVLRPTASIASEAGADGVNPCTIGIEFEDGGDPLDVIRPAAQYEVGARLIAGIAARWDIPLDREHVVGHREIFAAKECPGNLDLERLIAQAGQLVADRGPALTCLLPARNAAGDIPGYLDSAASLGAEVIALDDGSTDDTAVLLGNSALVSVLLRAPRRPSFEGWDDGANRQRLLGAATESGAEWVLFLDADERIDADDAMVLRRFLATDALPGVAYGLELYREWDGRVAGEPSHVFRLFANRPDYELRAGRFHFNPIPTAIPRRAWIRTTIRARHLDSHERLLERRQKYSETGAAPSGEGPASAFLEPPAGPLQKWEKRGADIPVLGARPVRASPAVGKDRPELVCLVPMRNCAADIDGYLESAARFADAVIALDDGSTDETAALLGEAALVTRVLRNERRDTYAGWDDAANRQRLLDAAVESGADWAMFLDADERIDPDDAAALSAFVTCDADPASAYGFRVHRMIGDAESYDRAGLWVYRMFAPRQGQRLPEEKLHLVPIPTAIPRTRWQKTTVRIQHLAGIDRTRRLARLRKYEEADPDRRWQRDYASHVLEPGTVRPWQPRPAELAVLADPLRIGATVDLEDIDTEAPVLSAIVIATDDEATIERSVRAVVEQQCPLPFEVIVVVSGSPQTAAVVRESLGERVALIELPDRVLPGKARNVGVEAARGEYLSFPGSHVEIAAGSLAERMLAHESGWAMVTGSITNGNPTPAGWASYFLDHSSALPGRPSGELAGAPAHCSYVREFLIDAGGFPENMRAGEDTVLNQELWRRGHRAYRERAIELAHRSPCSRIPHLVRHHFVRGRAFGRILRGDFHKSSGSSRATGRKALAGYSRRRLALTDDRVARWGGDLREHYARVRPLVRLGILAAGMGARFELLAGRSSGGAQQGGDGDQLKTAARQSSSDFGQRLGDNPVAGVVHEDDRARLG